MNCIRNTLALLALASIAVAQSGPAVDGARPVDGRGLSRAEPPSERLGLPDLFHAGNRFETAPLDHDALRAEDARAGDMGPVRMGIVQELSPVEPAGSGTWTPLFGGEQGWLWTASFRAPGALGLRLRLPVCDLPLGAELHVGGPEAGSTGFGPLTPNRGQAYWTPAIYAEELRVELLLAPGLAPEDLAGRVVIDALLHQYRVPGGDPAGGGYEGSPLPCHLDLACYPAWFTAADGVGILSYVAAPEGFFCSGAMLNRVGGDFTNLFATARHCGVTDANAASLLVTWLYEANGCGGLPPPPSTLPQSQGNTVLVQDPDTDYTLVGLDFTLVPVTYLGWDSNPFATGMNATGIHHPQGSWKRISFGTKVADLTSSCVGGNAYYWTEWPMFGGEVEPGCSGSPLLDVDGRVRGVASCSSWSCSSANGSVYGRFDAAFPDLAPYLLPVNPVYVDVAASGPEDGTTTDPFDELIEGAYAVLGGSTVNVRGGTYQLDATLSKAMTLQAYSGTVVIQ